MEDSSKSRQYKVSLFLNSSKIPANGLSLVLVRKDPLEWSRMILSLPAEERDGRRQM